MGKCQKTIVWLRGGLGNQLFQYAHGLAVSRLTFSTLVIRDDLLPLAADEFNGLSRWPEQISLFSHDGSVWSRSNQPLRGTSFYSKVHTAFLGILRAVPLFAPLVGFPSERSILQFIAGESKCLTMRGSVNLEGYFASAAAPLQFKETLESHVMSSDSNVQAERWSSKIFIHVRLGDQLRLNRTLTNSYIQGVRDSVKLCLEFNSASSFVMVSDEPELAAELLSEVPDLVFEVLNSSDMTPLDLLRTLASGAGIIAGHSTFAWWAAFFQKPTTIKIFIEPLNGALDFSKLTLPNLIKVDTKSSPSMNGSR